jgi:uncharacterized protein DUF4259
MLPPVEPWGVASFDNDAARDWFLTVEEATDPGAVLVAAIDEAISAADELEIEPACEAIAAAELCACCAGELTERLPTRVQAWVQANPHGPHADEVALMIQAVSRVRDDSELRLFWENAGDAAPWFADLADLLDRLNRSSAGEPPAVSP